MNKNNTYIICRIGKELFAINSANVESIQGQNPITEVPLSESYLIGVMNLRGKVLTVIDSHQKLNLPPIQSTIDTCIIVLNFETEDKEEIECGIMVDAVITVADLDDDIIKPLPTQISEHNPDNFLGIANVNNKFVMIINIQNLFSPQ